VAQDLLYLAQKNLWEGKGFAALVADPEQGLNCLLDELEDIQKNPDALARFEAMHASPYADMPVRIGNREQTMVWRSPVGIAAGFTKDGRGSITLIRGARIGSLELGTTPFLDQPGNPLPRFFIHRDPVTGMFSTINRFGFNSKGIVPLAHRLWGVRDTREESGAAKTPIIVSIGPNKVAVEQYEKDGDLDALISHLMNAFGVIIPLLRSGDALQINISSPNTPGLRNLFERLLDFLMPLKKRIRTLAELCGLPMPFLILKLSPDMMDHEIRTAVSIAAVSGIPALEAFNTTVDMDIKARYGITEAGGVGGDPLRELAEAKLRVVTDEIDKWNLDIDVIAVGGVTEPEHALTRLAMHPRVKAVQINSGIYKKGFALIKNTLAAIHASRAT